MTTSVPTLQAQIPLQAPPAPPRAANRDQIAATAKKFESSFIAAMLEPMFDALSTQAPFGGGQGEAAFKSFMVNAIATKISDRGGIGVSAVVQREMLKLQGAS